MRDNRKQSLYFNAKMLEEMRNEAERLDRSLSWLMAHAWRMAYREIKAMPTQRIIS